MLYERENARVGESEGVRVAALVVCKRQKKKEVGAEKEKKEGVGRVTVCQSISTNVFLNDYSSPTS